MNPNELPKGQFFPAMGLDYLRTVARNAGVADTPDVQRVLAWFCAGPMSPGKVAQAERLILRQGVRQVADENIAPAEPTALLGVQRDGKPWGVKLRSICQHLVAAGASGSGKSMFLLQLAHAVKAAATAANWDAHLLIFDCKRDMRRAARLINGLTVIRPENLRLNVLQNPKGMSLSAWAQVVCDFLSETFGLRQSTKYLLIQLVDQLYTQFATEATGKYPCLLDLNDMAKHMLESRQTPAADRSKLCTLLNKTQAFERRIADIVGVSRGFSIEDLLAHDVVIELDGLSLDLQKFLITGIRTQAFHYYLSNNMSDGKLKTCVFVDEAGQTMSRNSSEGPSTEKTTIRMSRSTGLGHVIAHQILGDIAADVRANSSTQIIKKLTYAPDMREAKTTLGLSEELFRLLPALPTNMAIVKGEEDSEAALITLRELPQEFRAPLLDSELARLVADPHSVFGHAVSARVFPEAPPAGQATATAPAERKVTRKAITMADWPTLLRFVQEHPDLGVVEIYAGLGLTRPSGDRLKKLWLDNGLVRQEAALPNGPGKPKTHMRLTDKGVSYLEQNPNLPRGQQ